MRKKDLFRHIAASVTCVAIAWVELNHLGLSWTALILGMGYLLFYTIFWQLAAEKNRFTQRQSSVLLFVLWLLVMSGLWQTKDTLTPILLIIIASLLPRFFSTRIAILVVTLNFILLCVALMQLMPTGEAIVNSILNFGFQFFALSSSQAEFSEQRARERAENLNNELISTRILLAQHSQREERLRIARDLHDILGHQLTGLSLHLEILQHKVPQTLKDDVKKTQSIAKDLLENIRQVVRAQRQSAQLDIAAALKTLLENLPKIRCDIRGDLRVKSVSLAEDLLLCLQEAISNAIRHGHATYLEFDFTQTFVEAGRQHIHIQLNDNGRGFNEPLVQGSGMQGIGERLAHYQGSLQITKRSSSDQQLAGCCVVIVCTELFASEKND